MLIFSLLGGVSVDQVFRGQAVTIAASLAAGSLGSLVALEREKTFQSLAISTLVLVLWIIGWQIVASGAMGATLGGISAEAWGLAMSPWQAVQEAARPRLDAGRDGWLADPTMLNILLLAGNRLAAERHRDCPCASVEPDP